MSKRTTYTTLTALPEGITRATVLETLHSHTEMIDLNPLVEERHPCKAPPSADAEEFHCQWYSMTDKINYLPGGLASGKVTYYCCFNDLSTGVQTHCYAPLGVNIRGKWTLGGSLPGEPKEAVELGLGVPKNGLWIREDVDLRCNYFLTKFVKKNLTSAHATLVDRMIEKAHLAERDIYNSRLSIAKPGYPAPYSSTTAGSEYQDSHSDSRSSKRLSMSTIGSPGLPYQHADSHHIEPAAPPYPYHGVDPAYSEANPYDRMHPSERPNSYDRTYPQDRTNPYDRTTSYDRPAQQPQSYHPMELPVQQSPITYGQQPFEAVELPVHDVAPLRITKTSPNTSPRTSQQTAPQIPEKASRPQQQFAPPPPNRLPGGGRPGQSSY